MKKLANVLSSTKAKFVTLATLGFVGASNAMAAVTMSNDGAVSGTFDVAPVLAVASALFIALGSLIVVRWAISFLRRA